MKKEKICVGDELNVDLHDTCNRIKNKKSLMMKMIPLFLIYFSFNLIYAISVDTYSIDEDPINLVVDQNNYIWIPYFVGYVVELDDNRNVLQTISNNFNTIFMD